MLLTRVRLEHDPGASYGRITGLDSPEHTRYTPKIQLKDRESKRYSLISQSSDSFSYSPSSDWKPSAIETPSFRGNQTRLTPSLYAVTVGSDSPYSTLDQVFDLTGKWQPDSPQAAQDSTSPIYKPITMWSTVSPSSASVSSSENTQTISWSRTPFKAPQISQSQKENHSPTVLTSVSKDAHATSSYSKRERGRLSFVPASASSSPFSVSISSEKPRSPIVPQLNIAQQIVRPQSSPLTHVGCLVDLNDGYESNLAHQEDENTITIRLALKQEMESLGAAMIEGNTQNVVSEASVGPSSEEMPVAIESDAPQVSSMVRLEDSSSPARSIASGSGETTELLFHSPLPNSAVNDSIEEDFDVGVADAIVRLLCDMSVETPKWMNSVRSMFSFETISNILIQLKQVHPNRINSIEASLVRLLEQGDVEGLDLQENGGNEPIRLFRASSDLFDKYRPSQPVS